jgi:hypothetical protein
MKLKNLLLTMLPTNGSSLSFLEKIYLFSKRNIQKDYHANKNFFKSKKCL